VTRRGLLTLAAAALLTFAATLSSGCGPESSASSGALDVVASTSFLADIAQNVAGDRSRVASLVPEGTDPHAFEPTPSDLKAVAGADLVVANGAGLEGALLTTLENAVGDTPVVDASAGLTTRVPKPGEPALAAGETDPHFWLNPELVKTYVRNIQAAFSEADPAGAATYAANAEAYVARLDALDTWIRGQVAQVPQADRKLVMDHASHGYFADRYGFTIVGTVIPSAATGESPTARQLSDLVATIRETGARAIFVEAGENPRLAEQIGAETGAAVVTDLLDHSLTAADGPAPTYIDMMRYDTRRIVEALR
jgi:zinc/manganese transport system substrate-binding protein/manganese/iron transport system substrate-binding protein